MSLRTNLLFSEKKGKIFWGRSGFERRVLSWRKLAISRRKQ